MAAPSIDPASGARSYMRTLVDNVRELLSDSSLWKSSADAESLRPILDRLYRAANETIRPERILEYAKDLQTEIESRIRLSDSDTRGYELMGLMDEVVKSIQGFVSVHFAPSVPTHVPIYTPAASYAPSVPADYKETEFQLIKNDMSKFSDNFDVRVISNPKERDVVAETLRSFSMNAAHARTPKELKHIMSSALQILNTFADRDNELIKTAKAKLVINIQSLNRIMGGGTRQRTRPRKATKRTRRLKRNVLRFT